MIPLHTRCRWNHTATPLLAIPTRPDANPRSRAHLVRRDRVHSCFRWSVPVYISREHLSEPLGEH